MYDLILDCILHHVGSYLSFQELYYYSSIGVLHHTLLVQAKNRKDEALVEIEHSPCLLSKLVYVIPQHVIDRLARRGMESYNRELVRATFLLGYDIPYCQGLSLVDLVAYDINTFGFLLSEQAHNVRLIRPNQDCESVIKVLALTSKYRSHVRVFDTLLHQAISLLCQEIRHLTSKDPTPLFTHPELRFRTKMLLSHTISTMGDYWDECLDVPDDVRSCLWVLLNLL